MLIFREIKALIGLFIIHYPDTFFGFWLREKYWRYVHKKNIGTDIQINRGAKIGLSNMVYIGNHFILGEYATLAAGDSKPLYIGDNVSIAKNVYIRTANHQFSDKSIPIAKQGHSSHTLIYANKEYSIVIENDVWIGVNSVILSGSHIGKGSVIGAGTVVSSKIPEYSIVLGNPGRVIAKRQ